MRPLVRYWRGKGLKAIDDGIVAVKEEAEAKAESTAVRRDLELAGFIVNIEKYAWEPSHRIQLLGFQIDLALGEFSVPAKKISVVKSKLAEAKQERILPAKQLASLIGKIISMSPALRPVTRLKTHSQRCQPAKNFRSETLRVKSHALHLLITHCTPPVVILGRLCIQKTKPYSYGLTVCII